MWLFQISFSKITPTTEHGVSEEWKAYYLITEENSINIL
jgi:hypothetical protein